MTDTIRYAMVILGAVLIVAAAYWPRVSRPNAPSDVALARGPMAVTPTITWASESEIQAMAGVYLRDGQPRYMLRGVDVSADEFRRARPDDWEQVQRWIRAQPR
jgi:hypothetical protein